MGYPHSTTGSAAGDVIVLTNRVNALIDHLTEMKARAENAEAALDRLRAGEADTPGNPYDWPTPAQWIRRWNDATPEMRLAIAEAVITLQRAAWDRAYASRP
jgi:hypothetical protein